MNQDSLGGSHGQIDKAAAGQETDNCSRFMMTFINGHWNLEFKEEAINPFAEIKNNFIGYFEVCKNFPPGDILSFGCDLKSCAFSQGLSFT